MNKTSNNVQAALPGVRRKRKTAMVIAGIVVCLAALGIWWCVEPQVEVHGPFSKQDVAELTRLGRVERRQDIMDWSETFPAWDIRQISSLSRIRTTRRRFRFHSAGVVRIDRMPDHIAEVTVGTGSLERHYGFVNTKQGWKPIRPVLE